MRSKLFLAAVGPGLALGLWLGAAAAQAPIVSRPVDPAAPLVPEAPVVTPVAVEPPILTPIEHTEGDHCRAGWPQETSCLAVHSDTGHYVGYYVGGGNPCCRKGDLPHPDEGTWGWDYSGWRFHRRVMLNWWHGRRYQGGVGAYATDGPNLKHRIEEHHEDRH